MRGFSEWKPIGGSSLLQRMGSHAVFFSSPAPAAATSLLGAGTTLAWGMRSLVPQARHRTSLPRAAAGTERMVRHVRFGQINLITWSDMCLLCVKWAPIGISAGKAAHLIIMADAGQNQHENTSEPRREQRSQHPNRPTTSRRRHLASRHSSFLLMEKRPMARVFCSTRVMMMPRSGAWAVWMVTFTFARLRSISRTVRKR